MEQRDDALTNHVWTDGERVVKYFRERPRSRYMVLAMRFLFLDFGAVNREERLQNEVAAAEKLQRIGIDTPDPVKMGESAVEREWIAGESLLEYLRKCDLETCFEYGYRKGRELAKLHRQGAAYFDCRCGNTVVTGEEMYSIDHEFFEEDADRYMQEWDLMTLLGTAKSLQSRRYRRFLRGVKEGYGDRYERFHLPRVVLGLFSSLGYVLAGNQDARSALRVVKNWTQDLLEGGKA